MANRATCHITLRILITKSRTCVPGAGIKGRDKSFHPTDTVGCNYVSLPLIPTSGTQVFKSAWDLQIGHYSRGFQWWSKLWVSKNHIIEKYDKNQEIHTPDFIHIYLLSYFESAMYSGRAGSPKPMCLLRLIFWDCYARCVLKSLVKYPLTIISSVQWKTAVTPLLTRWALYYYSNLALSQDL